MDAAPTTGQDHVAGSPSAHGVDHDDLTCRFPHREPFRFSR